MYMYIYINRVTLTGENKFLALSQGTSAPPHYPLWGHT